MNENVSNVDDQSCEHCDARDRKKFIYFIGMTSALAGRIIIGLASSATVLLFTTGRGTPLGFPAPTIKAVINTKLTTHKKHWIDFNAGSLLDENKSLEQLSDELLDFIIQVASGKQIKNDANGYREIAIWKQGVTL